MVVLKIHDHTYPAWSVFCLMYGLSAAEPRKARASWVDRLGGAECIASASV